MRAEGVAGTFTCPRVNAAWPIIPTFHRMADGYWLLRWTAEVRFCPAGSFHSRAQTTLRLLALLMAPAFQAPGHLTVNGSISLPRRMTSISGVSAFQMETRSS